MNDLYILREGEPIDYDALRAAFVIACDSERLAEAVKRDMRVDPVPLWKAQEDAERVNWMFAAERNAAHARYEYDTTCGVSVIIPCHNYAQFVTEALDSVLAQTRPAEDIIVVNDASTDHSKEVIQDYISAHPTAPIQLINNEHNLDLAASENIGIAAATQEHLICLDADDKIEPHYIETLHDAMRADLSLGVAYSGVQVLVQDDGTTYPAGDFGAFDWEWMATPTDPPRTAIPKPSMFRRAMWTRVGGFQQTYKAGEDVDFWLRGLACGFNARKVTSENLFTYRVHSQQQMSRARKFTRIDHYKPWMRDGKYPFAAPTRIPLAVPDLGHPVVSVIIPVGPDHVGWVPSALESVLGQTVRAWEVILVNDTGNGFPPAVLLPYPFVRVVDGGQQGVAHARNAGLEAARAPLVCFLDADDWLEPTALQHLLARYAQGDAGYVYGDLMMCDAAGVQRPFPVPDYVHDLNHALGFYGGVTGVMATEHARALSGFDDRTHGFEDWDFFVRAAIAGFCGRHVSYPTFVYREHTGARRVSSNARRDEILHVFDERYGEYLRGGKPMSPCCPGNGDAIIAARNAILGLNDVAEIAQDGLVQMEYIGKLAGPVTYFGRYIGANNPMDKLAHDARGVQGVDPRDVPRMAASGKFRVIESPLLPAPEPIGYTPTVAEKIAQAEAIKPLVDVEAQLEQMKREGVEYNEVQNSQNPKSSHARPRRGAEIGPGMN